MDRLKTYLIVSKGYNIIVHQLNKDLLHQGLYKHKKRNRMFKSKTKELLISGVSSQPALKLTQTILKSISLFEDLSKLQCERLLSAIALITNYPHIHNKALENTHGMV